MKIIFSETTPEEQEIIDITYEAVRLHKEAYLWFGVSIGFVGLEILLLVNDKLVAGLISMVGGMAFGIACHFTAKKAHEKAHEAMDMIENYQKK